MSHSFTSISIILYNWRRSLFLFDGDLDRLVEYVLHGITEGKGRCWKHHQAVCDLFLYSSTSRDIGQDNEEKKRNHWMLPSFRWIEHRLQFLSWIIISILLTVLKSEWRFSFVATNNNRFQRLIKWYSRWHNEGANGIASSQLESNRNTEKSMLMISSYS